jgi:hypothetical protein
MFRLVKSFFSSKGFTVYKSQDCTEFIQHVLSDPEGKLLSIVYDPTKSCIVQLATCYGLQDLRTIILVDIIEILRLEFTSSMTH